MATSFFASGNILIFFGQLVVDTASTTTLGRAPHDTKSYSFSAV